MLVGYDANNVFRNGGKMGDWARALVNRLASRKGASFRALLFATRMKAEYRSTFTSYANVGTFVPTGSAKLMPSTWMRFGIGSYLEEERVKVFHGLNEELPYSLKGKVKSVVTMFGTTEHYKTSLMDSLLWKKRVRYALEVADVVVAVSEKVKQELTAAGVKEEKIVVIGTENPYEVTDEMAEQYLKLYEKLING